MLLHGSKGEIKKRKKYTVDMVQKEKLRRERNIQWTWFKRRN